MRPELASSPHTRKELWPGTYNAAPCTLFCHRLTVGIDFLRIWPDTRAISRACNGETEDIAEYCSAAVVGLERLLRRLCSCRAQTMAARQALQPRSSGSLSLPMSFPWRPMRCALTDPYCMQAWGCVHSVHMVCMLLLKNWIPEPGTAHCNPGCGPGKSLHTCNLQPRQIQEAAYRRSAVRNHL